MKIMIKKIILAVLIILVLSFIIFCEYKLFDCKKYANVYSGTVVKVYESHGRSSTCFAFVDFAGDIQEVNTGHYLYRIGETFSYKLEWSFFGGLYGLVYVYNPPEYNLIYPMIAFICNICIFCFVIFLIIGIIKYCMENN